MLCTRWIIACPYNPVCVHTQNLSVGFCLSYSVFLVLAYMQEREKEQCRQRQSVLVLSVLRLAYTRNWTYTCTFSTPCNSVSVCSWVLVDVCACVCVHACSYLCSSVCVCACRCMYVYQYTQARERDRVFVCVLSLSLPLHANMFSSKTSLSHFSLLPTNTNMYLMYFVCTHVHTLKFVHICLLFSIIFIFLSLSNSLPSPVCLYMCFCTCMCLHQCVQEREKDRKKILLCSVCWLTNPMNCVSRLLVCESNHMYSNDKLSSQVFLFYPRTHISMYAHVWWMHAHTFQFVFLHMISVFLSLHLPFCPFVCAR